MVEGAYVAGHTPSRPNLQSPPSKHACAQSLLYDATKRVWLTVNKLALVKGGIKKFVNVNVNMNVKK
jgi:hypothetical protein